MRVELSNYFSFAWEQISCTPYGSSPHYETEVAEIFWSFTAASVQWWHVLHSFCHLSRSSAFCFKVGFGYNFRLDINESAKVYLDKIKGMVVKYPCGLGEAYCLSLKRCPQLEGLLRHWSGVIWECCIGIVIRNMLLTLLKLHLVHQQLPKPCSPKRGYNNPYLCNLRYQPSIVCSMWCCPQCS